MFRWIYRTMVQGGVSKDELRRIMPAVHRRNRNSLTLGSLFGTVLFFLLMTATFFQPSMQSSRVMYAAMAFFCAIFSLLSLATPKKLISVMVFIFMSTVFGFGIYLGTIFSPQSSATTFCVLLIALPMFFIERPLSRTRPRHRSFNRTVHQGRL